MEAILKIGDIKLVCAVDKVHLDNLGEEAVKAILTSTLSKKFVEEYKDKIEFRLLTNTHPKGNK